MEASVPSKENWPTVFRARCGERRLSKTVVAQEKWMDWVFDES